MYWIVREFISQEAVGAVSGEIKSCVMENDAGVWIQKIEDKNGVFVLFRRATEEERSLRFYDEGMDNNSASWIPTHTIEATSAEEFDTFKAFELGLIHEED